MILHIINQSETKSDIMNTCLRVIDNAGLILLIENGVISGTSHLLQRKSNLLKLAQQGRVYVLMEDLIARGLTEFKHSAIKTVDYKGFVGLVQQCQSTLSWY